MRWKDLLKDTFQGIYNILIVVFSIIYLFSGFGIGICVWVENTFGYPYGYILFCIDFALLLSFSGYKIYKNYKE